MPKWEYTSIDLNDIPRRSSDIDVLNAAGEKGWELVIIRSNRMAILKRQVVEDPVSAPATPSKRAAKKT